MLKICFRSIPGIIAIGLMSLSLPALVDDARTSAATSIDPDGPVAGCSKGSEDEGFFTRLGQSYQTHLAWNGGDPNARYNYATGIGGNYPAGAAYIPERYSYLRELRCVERYWTRERAS
jgi:hypothetical protein